MRKNKKNKKKTNKKRSLSIQVLHISDLFEQRWQRKLTLAELVCIRLSVCVIRLSVCVRAPPSEIPESPTSLSLSVFSSVIISCGTFFFSYLIAKKKVASIPLPRLTVEVTIPSVTSHSSLCLTCVACRRASASLHFTRRLPAQVHPLPPCGHCRSPWQARRPYHVQ
jgi:hypothetical protein